MPVVLEDIDWKVLVALSSNGSSQQSQPLCRLLLHCRDVHGDVLQDPVVSELSSHELKELIGQLVQVREQMTGRES